VGSSAVRKGVINARFNERNVKYLAGEILIISAIVGFMAQSWWGFGGIYLVLMIFCCIKPLAMPLALALSIIWAVIGYYIGSIFSESASFVVAILGLLGGIGCHLSALEWVRDLGTDNA
jgi:hypothetical protein